MTSLNPLISSFSNPLQLGDCRLEMLLDERGFFRGIGAVSQGETPLRDGSRSLFCQIATPDGHEFFDWRLLGITAHNGGATLRLSPHRRFASVMEWRLHASRPLRPTSDWDANAAFEPEVVLELELLPVTRQVNGREWNGFSYSYRYASEKYPIYQILDRGTWEIGGHTQNNQFWMRNGCTDSIVGFAAGENSSGKDAFSTEWYLPGILNPNIFQFHPLQTQLQGFTFTAAREGVLWTWPTQVAHVRSLFEKKAGGTTLEHWHEHCDDLSADFKTSPVEVLFCPGEFGFAARHNLYEDVREHVYESLHRQIGWKRERVQTYGVMEEWGDANLDFYRENGLPQLAQAGVKRVFLANHFRNAMNTWGVSNMCCTVDWSFPDELQNPIERLGATARMTGLKLEMWGNTALSSLTQIFHQRHGREKGVTFLPKSADILNTLSGDEIWVRDPAGHVETDHYPPVFLCLNLRSSKVRAHWLESWDAVKKIGIDAIFVDSSFNLSSDSFHYSFAENGQEHGATLDQAHLLGHSRPQTAPRSTISTQYHAYLSLMAQMQERGFSICGEDCGVFGIHRSGPSATMRFGPREAPVAPLWSDSLCVFDAPALENSGWKADEAFFWGLAFRLMWFVYWEPETGHLTFNQGTKNQTPTLWHCGWLHLYNELEARMQNRRILFGGNDRWLGVLYSDPQSQTHTLWAFESFEWELPQTGLLECWNGTEHSVHPNATRIRTQPLAVYRVGAP